MTEPDDDVADIRLEDLTLHYQPQLLADGSRVVAVEALLRSRDGLPVGIGPAEILKAFGTPERMEALDWWVIETACRDAARWPNLTVGVNLGADRFRDRDFPARLSAMVARLGMAPQRLELEIVESSYIGDFDTALAIIVSLRQAGFRVALDDFGTGFSSLTYLLRLPFDKLKIDKSFVDDVTSMKSTAIVHSVVALARAIGLKITVEGVETEEQRRFLKAAGCHFLQGWLFHKAMPAEDVSRLLRQQGDTVVEIAPPTVSSDPA